MTESEIFWLDSWKGKMERIESIEVITIMISPLLMAVFYSLCVLNGVVFLIPLVICFIAFLVASYFFLTVKKKVL